MQDYGDIQKLKALYLDQEKLRIFTLNPDIKHLDKGYKKAIPKLIRALQIIDIIFLMQDHPQSLQLKNNLLKDSKENKDLNSALEIFNIFNGPEGITLDNEYVQLFPNIIPRPKGGTLYDYSLTSEEIEEYLKKNKEHAEEFRKINTLIKKEGNKLITIPYEKEYAKYLNEISKLLKEASEDVPDKKFSKYLKSRAEALVNGDYYNSDIDWVNSTDSPIDLIIGPLEPYGDNIMSKKSFYGGLLCIRNLEESKRVSEYINHLNELENNLPQDKKHSKDMNKISIPVAVVDVIFMTGDYQAKRLGVVVGQTLPNDEKIIKDFGRKIFIYKNILEGFETNQEARDRLIDSSLHKYINKRAKVNEVVGHEVSHSLGPKITVKKDVNNKYLSVDTALGSSQNIIEELKADLLSIYNIDYLVHKNLYNEEEKIEVYVEDALMSNLPDNKPDIDKDVYPAMRLMKFNYFLKNKGLILKEGKFSINIDKVKILTKEIIKDLLDIQVNGDKTKAEEYIKKWAYWGEEADYVCKALKECKLKIYKIVRQPLAEKIISQYNPL